MEKIEQKVYKLAELGVPKYKINHIPLFEDIVFIQTEKTRIS